MMLREQVLEVPAIRLDARLKSLPEGQDSLFNRSLRQTAPNVFQHGLQLRYGYAGVAAAAVSRVHRKRRMATQFSRFEPIGLLCLVRYAAAVRTPFAKTEIRSRVEDRAGRHLEQSAARID